MRTHAREHVLFTLRRGLYHDMNNAMMALQSYSEMDPDYLLDSDRRHYVHRISMALAALRYELDKGGTDELRVTALFANVRNQVRAYRQHLELFQIRSSKPVNDSTLRSVTTFESFLDSIMGIGITSPDPITDVHGGLLQFNPLLRALLGHGIPLSLELNATRTACVPLHPVSWQRILINIAANARQAMPVNGKLSVTTHDTPRATSVQFTDTGPGMDAGMLQAVLAGTYSSKRPAGEGGRGVATIIQLCQDMNISTSLTSVVERGTTWRLLIPRP